MLRLFSCLVGYGETWCIFFPFLDLNVVIVVNSVRDNLKLAAVRTIERYPLLTRNMPIHYLSCLDITKCRPFLPM